MYLIKIKNFILRYGIGSKRASHKFGENTCRMDIGQKTYPNCKNNSYNSIIRQTTY